MNFFNKPSKQDVATTTSILIWVFVVNVVAMVFTTTPAWPMFFVTIFFFAMDGNLKNIPMIFLGGFTGIVMTYLLANILEPLSVAIGEVPAMMILLFSLLALIIVGGSYLPMIFNNITFAYVTICTLILDPAYICQNFVGWIIMLIVGGGIILGGALGIVVLCTKLFSKSKSTVMENSET